MRLCFLGNLGSIHLQRWLRYLVDRGHEVHYLGWQPQPVPVAGLQVHWLYVDLPRLPALLEIDLRGRWRRTVRAYWDGCAWVT